MTDAPPPLDAIAREYVVLAFGIERHVPGYVDAYVGPPEVRREVEAGEAPEPVGLLAAARGLAVRLAEADLAESRVGYLTAQVGAMIALCRRLAGETFAYKDEVRLLFDIEPEATPEAGFEAVIAELDRRLPGTGNVAERMVEWRRGWEISAETARALIGLIEPEIRRRTLEFVELPEGEGVEFRFVADKPWGGYNWFLGNGRSRVELNTDLPLHAHRLPDLLCHEAYPGHHAEHALKEARLYRERGYGEHAIQLINTPECVVSEGIATLAEGVIFGREEAVRFRADRLYPAAGLAGRGDAARELAITEAAGALRPVAGNAALLRHEEGRGEEEVLAYLRRYALLSEAEARQRLRFIDDPLWRAYVFTYHAGRDLLGAWLDAGPPAERQARFRTLLTEQVYPSQVVQWVSRGEAAHTAEEPASIHHP